MTSLTLLRIISGKKPRINPMSNVADLSVKINVDGADEVKSTLGSVDLALARMGRTAMEAGRGVASADSSLTRFSARAEESAGKTRAAGAELGRFGTGFRSLGESAMNAGRALLYASGALAAFAGGAALKGLFDNGVEMDNLTRGLNAVTGSGAETQRQLVSLREVAKLPGLGLTEAIQGSINLQAAGLSASLAQRSLMAFGNALATVGKGKADLDGVSLALTQISAKGKVTAEDVLQIQERVPQIRAAMQAAFGTSDTEALQKMGLSSTDFINGVVTQLAKLPSVTGGAGNALENLGDKIKITFLPLGSALARVFESAEPAIESILNKLGPLIDRVSAVFGQVANSGALARAFEMAADGVGKLLGQFGDGSGNAVTLWVSRVLSAISMAPTVAAQFASNVGDAFSALKDNAAEVFRFLMEKGMAAAQYMAVAFANNIDTIKTALSAIPDAITSLMSGHFEVAANLLKTKSGSDLDMDPAGKANESMALSRFNAVRPLTLRDIPALGTTLLPSLFSKTGDFQKMISGASSAAPKLPDTGSPVMQIQQKQAAALERIAANTGKTADVLSLRRQATGGGALGSLGVTPAELASGPRGGRQAGGYSIIQISTAGTGNQLERVINNMIQKAFREAGGQGFRPRNA